jgi:hypothetical protein
MPREGVAARMRVNGRRGFADGGIVGCAVLVIVGGVVWWSGESGTRGRFCGRLGSKRVGT